MALRNFARLWVPLILWMFFIFSASTDVMSAENTSRILVPILRWLKPDISLAAIETIHFLIRKAAHVAEYAIFAALLWRAIRHGTKLRASFRFEAVLVFFLGVLYAASDEFHQLFVKSRGPSVRDVIIDGGGILLGIFAYWLIAGKHHAR